MPTPRAARPSSPPPEAPAERLQATVDDLSQNVRVLTDIVGQLREDLSWLTRNGLPHQPLHVIIHHVPRTADSTDRASFQIALANQGQDDPTAALSDEQLETLTDQIVEQLGEFLGEVAQEQLNVLLSGMDHAHREVMKAIRFPESTKTGGDSSAERGSGRHRTAPMSSLLSPVPDQEPTPPGQLF